MPPPQSSLMAASLTPTCMTPEQKKRNLRTGLDPGLDRAMFFIGFMVKMVLLAH